jgi:hypothetical protein
MHIETDTNLENMKLKPINNLNQCCLKTIVSLYLRATSIKFYPHSWVVHIRLWNDFDVASNN